jgi:hypothetical protein
MVTRLLPVLLIVLFAGIAEAGPRAELWDRWLAHDPDSQVIVDHGRWGDLIGRHMVPGRDGINRLDYGGIARGSRAELDGYVEELQAVPVSTLDRDEQMAYWINLYNALTVQVVLDHHPVDSIRDINISPGWFTRGPWGAKLARVEGEALSLDDIEHRILRPIWQDARIHYAVNCASIGCPNLQPEPFAAGTLERLLEQGARDHVNHPRGARVENGRLVVSSIYHWFKDDFGADDAGVIRHLRAYAEPELAEALQGVTRIARHHYDWSLNDARVSGS